MTPPEAPETGTTSAVSLRLQVLKKRADFLAAARAARVATPGLVLQARARSPHEDASGIRVGFTCTKTVLGKGLDSGTAFEILSVDIADVDVGDNIGAKLQTEQAEADKQVAQAKAEGRRAMAVAAEQEMTALLEEYTLLLHVTTPIRFAVRVKKSRRV